MLTRLLAAALLAGPVAAGATTLIDGSFEAKGAALPVTDYCYDGQATPGGPACAASPWGGTGNRGVIVSGSGPWGGPVAPDGGYLGFIQTTGTLTQSFTATTTSPHGTVSWLDANRTNYGGQQTYTVTLSDGVTTTTLGSYAPTGTFTPHTTALVPLTAGTTYTLGFNGLATGDSTAFIDAVALGAVPDAPTWALLIAGFGLVGVAARRRGTVVAA